MSDVARLLGWFEAGTLVRPCTEVPDSVDLARAILSLAGAPAIVMTPNAARIAAIAGPSDHYVFVLVDGLGMNLIDELPADSYFRENFAVELQAVCPSSTAPALTSLATGRWPGEHAVTGWFVYLDEWAVDAIVLPYIERYSKRPLPEFGVDSGSVFPVPSALPCMTHVARCYLPKHIAGSTYSEYFGGGVPTTGYNRLGDACKAIVRRIAEASTPTYSYLYVPYVDQAQHAHGPHADPVRQITADVERTMARLTAELAGRARVVITADHGLIGVEPKHQYELPDDDSLLELLVTPPSCESRILALHARERRDGELASLFRERFGETFALLTIDEADDLRIFAPTPLSQASRLRLGDFVAISGAANGIFHRKDAPMLGFHGGLSPEEMHIPLIVA